MKTRLFCLDLLRGLDIFLLTALGPCLRAAGELWHWPQPVMAQLSHPWGGFTLWDIIMPMFIFMCGAAVPFALEKRLDSEGRPTAAFWKHVAFRVAMLWVLGMIVQGRLLSLNPLEINFYNNTLQTIAAGYFVAAMALLVKSRWFRAVLPFVLVAIYAVIIHFCGDYSRDGNCAMVVEKKILAVILPVNTKVNLGGYTWYLTTLMFGAMTLFGLQATMILRSSRFSPVKRGIVLLGYGAALLGIGWALVAAGIPMIKQFFTASFTLQAMGWCMIALAVLYFITDVAGFKQGMGLFILYGQFALTAYLFGGVFRSAPKAFAVDCLRGTERLIGKPSMPLVYAIGTAVVLTLILAIRRRLKARDK